MKTITIEVTAEDIARGNSCSISACPIAMAAERILGRPVIVGLFYIHISSPKVSLRMPLEGERFVADLLYGKTVGPISFPLEVPDNFIPMGVA